MFVFKNIQHNFWRWRLHIIFSDEKFYLAPIHKNKSMKWNPDINYSFQNNISNLWRHFLHTNSFAENNLCCNYNFSWYLCNLKGTRVQMVKNKQTKTLLLIYSKIGNKIKKNRKANKTKNYGQVVIEKKCYVFFKAWLYFSFCVGKPLTVRMLCSPKQKMFCQS